MKFIYADSLDYVDPDFDFLEDRHCPTRSPYWDDQFTHEYMGYAPYDGILVSRAIVGDHRFAGKYTAAQSRRFRRVGAAEFLRYNGGLLFGDCGAFSYHKMEEPPYSAADMAAFYEDGGFTHGCSVDHVVFEYNVKYDEGVAPPLEAERRVDITLSNAEEFLHEARHVGDQFTPLGVVQGWSPESMAKSARALEAMGYRYLAIGGMVPLQAPAIKRCLHAIREKISRATDLHLLGFAKADQISEFTGFGITSFDTTSPLLRAFTDKKSNYYVRDGEDRLKYYTAIRVPQSLENLRLNRLVKAGIWRQEVLQNLERRALTLLRAYDRGVASLDEALEAVMAYSKPLFHDAGKSVEKNEKALEEYRGSYRRTLEDMPWKECKCPVCSRVGIDVIIFRSSNRNKRRGMHNLAVYYDHIQRINERGRGVHGDENTDLFSHSS